MSNKLAILVDTKGPEIRTTKTESGEPIQMIAGNRVKIIGNPDVLSNEQCVAVSYKDIVKDLSLGDDILFDDGEIDLKVIEKNEESLICEVLNDGKLGSRKSVNVPGVRINLPALTDKDRHFIKLAVENDVDFIAHSFVRSKEDVSRYSSCSTSTTAQSR